MHDSQIVVNELLREQRDPAMSWFPTIYSKLFNFDSHCAVSVGQIGSQHDLFCEFVFVHRRWSLYLMWYKESDNIWNRYFHLHSCYALKVQSISIYIMSVCVTFLFKTIKSATSPPPNPGTIPHPRFSFSRRTLIIFDNKSSYMLLPLTTCYLSVSLPALIPLSRVDSACDYS